MIFLCFIDLIKSCSMDFSVVKNAVMKYLVICSTHLSHSKKGLLYVTFQ